MRAGVVGTDCTKYAKVEDGEATGRDDQDRRPARARAYNGRQDKERAGENYA